MTENLAAAALITFLISTLEKSSWFPWLSTETEKLNRLVAIVLSGVATIGIHVTFDSQGHQLGSSVFQSNVRQSMIMTGLRVVSIPNRIFDFLIDRASPRQGHHALSR